MLAAPSLQLFLILIGTDSENLIKDPLDNPHCGSVPRQQPPMPSAQHQLQTRMLIVGGSEAQPDTWPWQVAVLNSKNQLICGGTLVSNEFVLTAAHCIQPGNKRLRIVAGEYNLADKESEDRQERNVSRIYKHPQYNNKLVDNDIALLKLDQPVVLTTEVWPACLPDQDEELDAETNATILGWGATRYLRNKDGKPLVERDDMLREAKVPVVDFAECKQSYGDYLKTFNVICAGYKEGQIDSCAGDSGGPLLVQRNSRWYVYGVTSFGDECGKEGKYGIYSKTSTYINWIKRTISRFTSSRVSV